MIRDGTKTVEKNFSHRKHEMIRNGTKTVEKNFMRGEFTDAD